MDHIYLLVSGLSLTELILGGALLFFFLLQVLFYLLVYNSPYRHHKKQQSASLQDDELPPISVIIPSKNNSEELAKNLPYIMEQDYPNFEVVVVNSGSTDETDMVLKAAALKYPHLYHTYVPDEAESVNEKKLALTIGIKAAKHEHLLFTEAYCKPCTPNWIREHGNAFAQNMDIILGFSRLTIGKKAGMRGFIRYDNFMHHIKFLSMALLKKPYMGIGRNLAYRKELFFRHKGFSSILHIDGGEDDLYINRIAPGVRTGVVLSPESMTEAHGIDSFFTWRSLKSKYLYTKQYYRGVAPRILSMESFTRYAFYLLFTSAVVMGLITGSLLLTGTALLLFLLRYGMQLWVINRASKLVDNTRYHINLLLYDLFHPFNNFRFRRYAKKRTRYRR